MPEQISRSAYFNPRSYKRSDVDTPYAHYQYVGISIHAPTRGATGISRRTYMETRISIHAPTRGATYQSKERERF